MLQLTLQGQSEIKLSKSEALNFQITKHSSIQIQKHSFFFKIQRHSFFKFKNTQFSNQKVLIFQIQTDSFLEFKSTHFESLRLQRCSFVDVLCALRGGFYRCVRMRQSDSCQSVVCVWVEGTAVCHYGFGAWRRYSPLIMILSFSFNVSVFCVHDTLMHTPRPYFVGRGDCAFGVSFLAFSAITDILIYTLPMLYYSYSCVFLFLHSFSHFRNTHFSSLKALVLPI